MARVRERGGRRRWLERGREQGGSGEGDGERERLRAVGSRRPRRGGGGPAGVGSERGIRNDHIALQQIKSTKIYILQKR